MPLEIVRNNIADMKTDAVVNTANPLPIVGPGVDAEIYRKAGSKLLEARKKIGRLEVCQVAATPGFDLSAKYIIHVSGPRWYGGDKGEKVLLRQCYLNALHLAVKLKCKSIAFPILAAGFYHFPGEIALHIAVETCKNFLETHELQVALVVFDKELTLLSKELLKDVKSYIDDNYVEKKQQEEHEWDRVSRCSDELMDEVKCLKRLSHSDLYRFKIRHYEMLEKKSVCREELTLKTYKAQDAGSLEEILKKQDAGFSETLLKLITKSKHSDVEIYKKANVDRKLFSKIRKNPQYKPSKATAIAFAFALELDLEDTKDFIGRAGYALTHSSKFDLIVEFFIKKKNYSILELNEALYKYNQPLVNA